MKRLFPRAVPETLVALMLLGGACSPNNNVKSGAPVLTTLSLVDPNNHNNHFVDVTADTPACAMGAAEGKDCDPGTAVCELAANVVCKCVAKDMCDPTINAADPTTGGTLSCTFPPLSAVLATFDRLIDTSPFTDMVSVASLTAAPPAMQGQMTPTASSDYNSAGSSTGLVFTMFFNAPAGPSIVVSGNPAMPTDSTVTIALDKGVIVSKDKKNSFVGSNLLVDGTIAFKTSSFDASISVPAPPPPMSTDQGMMMMGCPDAGAMTPPVMDAGATDGGDAGAVDGAAADGGETTDGGADGGVADAGLTAEAGATADAGATSSDAGSDAAVTPPPPASSGDVPLDMNMGTVTITFTNNVTADVLTHIKVTEDGQDFTAFTAMLGSPPTTVTITPKTMWAAGKTYEVTLDGTATDALGKPLGAAVMAAFTMSAQ